MVYMYVDANRVKSWELVRNGSLRIIKILGPTVAVCCRNTLTLAEYRKIAGGDTRPTNQPRGLQILIFQLMSRSGQSLL